MILWLCGPSGVGKSTVGWELFRLVRATRKAGYLDFDQIGFCLPAPADDPDNHRLKSLNFASVWTSFQATGAECLVVSGIVDTAEQLALYTAAVPSPVTVCRLRATPETLTHRIDLRGWGGGPPVPGDELKGLPPERLATLASETIANAARLDRDNLGDLHVDTDGLTVTEVAQTILRRTGWAKQA